MSTIEELLNRAKTLQSCGQLPAAEQLYRQVLATDAANIDALVELAAVCDSLGRLDEAAAALERAAQLHPDLTDAHHRLALVLIKQRRLPEAEAALRRVLDLVPDAAGALLNLGLLLDMQDKPDEAIDCCRRCLELKPRSAQAHLNLGSLLDKQVRFDEAADCYRLAIEHQPELAAAHFKLGLVQLRLGMGDDAVASLRKARQYDRGSATIHSSLLHAIQYQPDVTCSELLQEHRQFDEQHARALRASWRPHGNTRIPNRKLRVGFVSADLRFHPVGHFLARVLENFDPQQIETICYSEPPRGDAVTDRLKSAANQWRDVRGLTDEDLADRIRADSVDILFDLAGHTGDNRLLAFARKPAPIQMTWMGYVGTTGLQAIDYLLADRHEVPAGAERWITERVLRLPDGYLCYEPPAHAPDVSPLPARAHGYVTFGSYNSLAKITPQVVETWARILERVAGSRLALKYLGLEAASARRRLTELFAARGIASDRLDLLAASPHGELLRQYQQTDLALDPFPYSGGLTTCEALWMGVPVVTSPGETFAGRHALSHLSNVGLTDTIARDLDDYVELAVGLASDLPRLAALRATLRARMAASPLCDGPRFARHLTSELREAWRRWCAERN